MFKNEDQLHCVSLSTPFRGTITVLEVATSNPLMSEKKKGLFVHGPVQVRGPWKFMDFYKAQEIAGVHRRGDIS